MLHFINLFCGTPIALLVRQLWNNLTHSREVLPKMICRGSIFAVTVALGFSCGTAYAQDACDSSGVQAAIDDFASTNECNADGFYFSVDEMVSNIDSTCQELSAPKCKKCVDAFGARDLIVVKNLVKDGLLDKSSLTDLKIGLKDQKESCGNAVPPTVAPIPTNSNGSGDDRDPQETPKPTASPQPTNVGENPTEPHNTPKPSPSATASPIPSASPSVPPSDIRAILRRAIEEGCPCHGKFTNHSEFVQCAQKIVDYGLTKKLISNDLAQSVTKDIQGSTCGIEKESRS